MSWSQYAAGSPSHVIAKVDDWQRRVQALDESRLERSAVAEAHQAQVYKVVEAVKTFAGLAPQHAEMTVSANGVHDGVYGLWNVTMGASTVPLPVEPKDE